MGEDDRLKHNKFHFCATCVHFLAWKENGEMLYKCRRLGYETKPNYTFNCWEPKEHVKALMEKREEEKTNE